MRFLSMIVFVCMVSLCILEQRAIRRINNEREELGEIRGLLIEQKDLLGERKDLLNEWNDQIDSRSRSLDKFAASLKAIAKVQEETFRSLNQFEEDLKAIAKDKKLFIPPKPQALDD